MTRKSYVVIEENGHVLSRHRTLEAAERAHAKVQAEVRRNGCSWHPCTVRACVDNS